MGATRFDVVVVGAGHNGLTLAALMARRGASVLVLERRDIIGGLCAGESFHAGYATAGIHHDTACVRRQAVDALELGVHGLQLREAHDILVPQANAAGVLIKRDVNAACAELENLSPKDAEGYRAFRSFIARVSAVVSPVLNDVPPDLATITASGLMGMARQGLALRALGGATMMDLMRIPPMAVGDWVREYFPTELLCAGVAHSAVTGTWCGPWSPGTASNLLARECTAGQVVAGGAAALARALERAARYHGATIRTGASVERIRVQSGVADGVVVAGGEAIDARVVVSSVDPRTTFLSLVHPHDISHAFGTRVEQFRMRGTTAKVHLALSRPIEFSSRPGLRVAAARTGETLDDIERAFDAVKYRGFSERPVLDVYVPTVDDPSLAPRGHDVVSILVNFAAHDLAGGWTDDARERLGDAVVNELSRYAPAVRDTIVAREVLTPADIAARYGVTGGHIHHGEHAVDQLVTRPTLETTRYATPIRNLLLCGGGSHPGGGATCAPAMIASRQIRL